MELALSLGDTSTPKPISVVADDQTDQSQQQQQNKKKMKELGLRMVLGSNNQIQGHDHHTNNFDDQDDDDDNKTNYCSSSSSDPRPLQLDLHPFSPSLHQSPPPPPASHRPFPWLSQILTGEASFQTKLGKGLDVKPLTAILYDPENREETAPVHESSPNDSNSDTSSFQLDFASIFRSSSSTRFPSSTKKPDMEYMRAGNNIDYLADVSKRDHQVRVCSRRRGSGYEETGGSDEDENGLGCRKKLRLTKQQSAFLEDSFKEHNTLNPKQKLILSNQLNLRPRQVEVWFQNRRARTKLKQTEVDCEYLKTCCETLTEENKRLHKELQELRALKTSKPFYMQLPATTLTMCPSCERVVTTSSTTTTPPNTTTATPQQPANGRP